MNEQEIEQVTAVFGNLGAENAQARIMAIQLLKRADQMAEERNTSRLEALNYLLQVTISGREGRVFDGQPPGNGASKPDKAPE